MMDRHMDNQCKSLAILNLKRISNVITYQFVSEPIVHILKKCTINDHNYHAKNSISKKCRYLVLSMISVEDREVHVVPPHFQIPNLLVFISISRAIFVYLQ